MSSGFDIHGERIDDVSGGCYLAFDPDAYVPYNISAIKALREKYGIPKNVEFIKAIQHVGASKEELDSIYLHS